MVLKRILLVLPLVVLSAARQEIAWQEYAVGDRVEITLSTGAPLTGRLAAPSPKVGSVDYTKASTLTIDLRGDMPGARGTITLSKRDIQSIRKLAPPGPGAPVVADESSAPSTDRINQAIRAKWGEAALRPAPAADDAEYLRRAYLDIIGVIPTLAEAESFLSDRAPDRRAKLVDRLLEHPHYAVHWADVWAQLLLGSRSDPRDLLYHFQLRDDLQKRFLRNVRYDEFAREVILAHGTVSQNPGQMMMAGADTPETSGLAVYVYRLFQDSQRDLPMALAGKLTRTFMGVQIQCAQCHDHPFDHWTQEDFYGMASFFTEVSPRREPVEGKTVPVPGMPDKTMPVYVFQVEDRPRAGRRGPGEMGAGPDLVIPDSKGKPVKPSFIGTGEGAGPGRPRRQEFARIMTSRDNLQFAKMAVNRYWAHFFGAGLVNPPDDFSGKNKATHPELLEDLAKDFIDSGYDLRWLIRSIAASEAYGLSSRSKDRTPEALRLLSVARVRSLSPEQLLTSVFAATSDPEARAEQMRGREDVRRRFLMGLLSQFRHAFDDDEGSEISEFTGSVPSALLLMNNELLTRGMRADGPATRLGQILKSNPSPAERIRAIFLTVLSRRPSPAELSRWQARVEESGGPAGYEDLMWTLLQTSEFLFNH